MTRKLLWDAGPGEVRVGLIEGGVLTEFRIIRPRRESALLEAGAHYTARITRRIDRRQVLATLGFGDDALIAPCAELNEGGLLVAEMLRPPIPEPGRWKRAKLRPVEGAAPQAAPAWHKTGDAAELALQRIAPTVDKIICASAAIANDVMSVIGDSGPSLQIDPGAIEDADFDTLIGQAVAGDVPIANGMLSIERTRAMTVIDIDGIGSALALNHAAALEIPRFLRLFDIGGPIGIDFVSLANRADRLTIDGVLGDAAAQLGQHERTAINGFGFCQIIRPRTALSIPEILCGTLVRQLSRESRAVALLRAVASSVGVGPRHVVASPPIIDVIRAWRDEIDDLRLSLGVPIELVPDATVTGYGYIHVGQR
jgi:ribonuclease G